MPDLNQAEDLAPGLGDDQPAPGGFDSLDRIGLEALGLENDAQAAEDKILNGGEDPAPPVDQGQAWGHLAMMVGGFMGMALPELRSVYTEQACMQWGAGMAAVADKYGWDAGDTAARWAPECALLLASVPLVIPTVQAIKARKAASKAKALNDAPEKPARAVATPPEDANPMNQEPGNFSVPT